MPTRKVLQGHHEFRKRFEAERDLFARLAEQGQAPPVFWIGCCDSRVIPEQITCADPGELFIMRNIANIVPPSGASSGAVGASIAYAVLNLAVTHIVVCGHSDCGGIKALESGAGNGCDSDVASWLRHARSALSRARAAGTSESGLHLATVRANVLLQLEHLRTYGCVQKACADGALTLHAWLYDVHSGVLSAHDAASGEWAGLPPP